MPYFFLRNARNPAIYETVCLLPFVQDNRHVVSVRYIWEIPDDVPSIQVLKTMG